MKKSLILALLFLLVVAGALAGVKALQIRRMTGPKGAGAPPPEKVTAAQVRSARWETRLAAVGSLEAVQGVTVAAEVSGKIVRIGFQPGAKVKAGEVLVQQDTSTEEAQLRAAEAALELARLNSARKGKLLASRTISASEFDNTAAQLKQAEAQVEQVRAAIGKKSIRAPFAGRLGLRLVNLGQVLREGDPIVAIQSLDPIFATFTLPQQQLARVGRGYAVQVTSDALPGETLTGRITAINPQVEAATRAIRMQATLANPREALRPGMFVGVAVVLPEVQQGLVIPVTAVLHAPYGDSVFVVEQAPGAAAAQVRQQFVRLGEKRGDFVVALSGLRDGESVVSTGVFKLRNGQPVMVDNRLAPEFELAPKPENS
jgi:membrane fusion protein (multidrug efflux system)